MSDAVPFVIAYVILLGTMLGSFVNLASDRLPRGESLVTPRSHCRSCGRVLNVVDLLPVLGYVIRRGRCATCGTPIGLSAPIVEAVCGACVAVPVLWLGPWPGGPVGLLLVGIYGSGVVARAMSRARPESPPDTGSGFARRAR